MQKEITVREFENVVSKIDDIEPMIVKRENKKLCRKAFLSSCIF